MSVSYAKTLRDKYNVTPLCSSAMPYYGTDMYRICKENNYITREDGRELELGFLNIKSMIKTPEL